MVDWANDPWASSSSTPSRGAYRGGRARGRGGGRGGRWRPISAPLPFGLINPWQLRYSPDRPRSGVADKPPTSAAYGRTLGFVTTAKLDELDKQREAYNKNFSNVLLSTSTEIDTNDTTALVNRLGTLYHTIMDHITPDTPRIIHGGSINLNDLGIWLTRARSDPNFDRNVIKDWIEGLETHVRQGEMKLAFARLCGRLYTDWLESGDAVTVRSDGGGQPLPAQEEEWEVIQGRKELREQVARLRAIILSDTAIDTTALETYLTDLFSTKSSMAILESMRAGMVEFGNHLRDHTITASDMQWTVESLLASDLMLPDKRAALREFTDNPTVLEEVANVIHMRLRTLSSWKWPEAGIDVDMRRYLNGRYRAFTDPDILDALFLQWVGVMWGLKFKKDVKDICGSDAWKVTRVGDDDGSTWLHPEKDVYGGTVNGGRRDHRFRYFAVGHLPDDVNPRAVYDEPADAAGDDGDSDDSDGPAAGGAGPDATVEVKQQLLNIMSTESYFNLALHDTHTIVRTDIEWFGPSLPHESIITILRFFGVPEDWLQFFRTFLRMPLRFPGEQQVQTRVRGTPISYALSGFFGEAVLYAMDFAVNQRANGLFLYRIHDDIWFWDYNSHRCAIAWQEMNKYARLVGVKFNQEKTGSVCLRGPQQVHPDLPTGDIRWGFLKFDVSQERFVIDQEQVDVHIKELRRQLDNTKSLLGWIGVYNKYMAFFVRNFSGRPAACFGKRHVMDMTRTLVRIQQEVIVSPVGEQVPTTTNTGVIEYLEAELARRYDVRDLPRGYFYFPLSVGGLALRDPLVDILVMGEDMDDDAMKCVKDALLKHEEVYEKAKKEWEEEKRQEAVSKGGGGDDSDSPPVYHSFKAHCEMASFDIWSVYAKLAKVNRPRVPAQLPPLIQSAVKEGMLGTEPYKAWVVEAYGKEVIRKFGGLEFVDSRMIPIGLVHLYKTSRISWDQ